LLTPMFATGVTVVVTGGLVLFVGFGSPVGELTVAMFVIAPLAGAVTFKVKFVIALAAKVPSDQLTIPAMFVPPPVALTNVTPTGKLSVTTTPPADDGPAFVTVIV
jgi:hypothetical protein